MKKTIVGLALLAASTCSFADWTAKWLSGNYTATMTYNGASISTTESMGTNGQVLGPVGRFADSVLSLYPEIKDAFDDNVRKVAAAEGASVRQTSLTGSLSASIAGVPNSPGVNEVKFSGPTYVASVSKGASTLGGLLWVDCTSRITLANINIKARYNVYTGAVTADSGVPVYTPGSSTSCSSSFDWIPLLGDAIDDIIASKVDTMVIGQLKSFSADSVVKLLPTQPSFYGVNTAILTGKYIFNGVDRGAYIKNNFATLFTGKALKLTIGFPIAEGEPVVGQSTPSGTFNNNIFTIDFSDSSTQWLFSVKSTKRYYYTWKCDLRDPGKVCPIP